jgi:hypothetical protein
MKTYLIKYWNQNYEGLAVVVTDNRAQAKLLFYKIDGHEEAEIKLCTELTPNNVVTHERMVYA